MAEHAVDGRIVEVGPMVEGLDDEVFAAVDQENQGIIRLLQQLELPLRPVASLCPQRVAEIVALEDEEALKKRGAAGNLAPLLDVDQGSLFIGPHGQTRRPEILQKVEHSDLGPTAGPHGEGV